MRRPLIAQLAVLAWSVYSVRGEPPSRDPEEDDQAITSDDRWSTLISSVDILDQLVMALGNVGGVTSITCESPKVWPNCESIIIEKPPELQAKFDDLRAASNGGDRDRDSTMIRQRSKEAFGAAQERRRRGPGWFKMPAMVQNKLKRVRAKYSANRVMSSAAEGTNYNGGTATTYERSPQASDGVAAQIAADVSAFISSISQPLTALEAHQVLNGPLTSDGWDEAVSARADSFIRYIRSRTMAQRTAGDDGEGEYHSLGPARASLVDSGAGKTDETLVTRLSMMEAGKTRVTREPREGHGKRKGAWRWWKKLRLPAYGKAETRNKSEEMASANDKTAVEATHVLSRSGIAKAAWWKRFLRRRDEGKRHGMKIKDDGVEAHS